MLHGSQTNTCYVFKLFGDRFKQLRINKVWVTLERVGWSLVFSPLPYLTHASNVLADCWLIPPVLSYFYIPYTSSTLPLQMTHYDAVTMGAMAARITSLEIVYSTFYSGADQSKHQSSASLAFVWEIHRGPVTSPHKWTVMRKMFPFDDVIIIFGQHPQHRRGTKAVFRQRHNVIKRRFRDM